VIVAGDLNDTPDSEPLQPLLTNSKLFNLVSEVSGAQGTYLKTKDQIDYLLASKALYDRLSEVAIERRGIFKNGQVEPFNTVTGPENQASDHAAVWASFDV
jgi:endonuclease/exonuclease/phosphatase family metal-dependent hydrolase